MFRFRILDLFLITAVVAAEISLFDRRQIGAVFCLAFLLFGLLVLSVAMTAFFSPSKEGMLDIGSNAVTQGMLWLLRIDFVFLCINFVLVIFGVGRS